MISVIVLSARFKNVDILMISFSLPFLLVDAKHPQKIVTVAAIFSASAR
jgi:hypothetical protein